MTHFLFASADAVAEVGESVGETIAQETATTFYLDVGIFCAFIFLVVFVGIFMGRRGRKEGKESESYFLAGRGLGWCLIGFSLIAANISTEQFVGMSGNAASYVGLAIASYEWLAAVTLVFVAFFFLPQFLKTGIYTIPEFLEKRYNRFSRTVMSILVAITLITVSFAAVVFAGAKTFVVLFKDVNLGPVPINILTLSFAIGFVAMVYVVCGGLKACAWADLLQGSALIAGGGFILYFALQALQVAEPTALVTTAGPVAGELADKLAGQTGWERFLELNPDKLRMNLPRTDPILPYTALIIGLWIPNFYYWGLNQYVVQRTLGAQSLSQGQKGIIFAAFMKLIIPFIIVFPGIIAFNLFSGELNQEAEFESRNGNTFQKFTEQKENSSGTLSLFDFNKNYFELKPEESQQIVDYNIAVLKANGIECTVSSDASALEQQAAVLKKVNEVNPERNRNAWKSWFTKKTGIEVSGAKTDNTDTINAGTTVDEPVEPVEPAEPDAEATNVATDTNADANADTSADTNVNTAVVGKPFVVEKQLIGYDFDSAFPLLVSKLIPPGFRGFVLAAILGALVSSLAAVLNAASTIITFDIYREYISPKSSEKSLVFVGRVCVVVFAICGCLIAQFLDNPKLDGIFSYIQAFQGFISPGILAAFIFGFFAKYAPGACGPTALLGSPIIYGLLMKFAPSIPFLDRMAITFAVVVAMLSFLTAFFPRKEPFVPAGDTTIDLRSSRSAKVFGVIVILVTISLYIYFWKYDWASLGNYFEELFFKLLP